MWPAFGIWRGVFDAARPAVAGMLDELARSGLATDWGARFLSRESALYEPLSYNNGASWPFLSGWAACALYKGGRPESAWQYVDALADLTFLESRGYIPELLSGDRARSIDAAVPHQLFATAGFASALMRGTIGLEETGTGWRISPHFPPGWTRLRLKNLRWRGSSADVEFRRAADRVAVTVSPRKGAFAVDVRVALPPGAELLSRSATLSLGGQSLSGEVRMRPGVELRVEQPPLRVGDEAQRLRIVETKVDAGVYTARLQGRRAATYRLSIDVPFDVVSIDLDGRPVMSQPESRTGRGRTVELTLPDGPAEWMDATLSVRLGRRVQ